MPLRAPGPPSISCVARPVTARLALLLVPLLPWVAPAVARADPPEIEAAPVSEGETVVVDGALDEPAWDRAARAGAFTERVPHPGASPPVATTFRVLRDAHAIYFGIEAGLGDGETPRGFERTRDSDAIWDDDAISLKIDPRRDRRSTVGFVVNPAGAQLDYVAIDNGRSVRREFDAVWQSAVQVLEDRWIVEVRIPIAALGLSSSAGPRSIGLNVTRDHNARAATYDWAPMPPEFGAFSALHYGVVTGLEGLGGGFPIAITPYGLAEHRWDESSGAHDVRAQVGLDAQARLGADVWLEASVLTDFAQVDLDDALVNLDRFPLFFPERRPFFLSGLDVFDFGVEQQVQPFYSRRIGLDRAGGRVPVLGGVKLYGREGEFSFGVLDVLTGSTADVDAANQLAARVRWAPGRGASYVGAIVVGREPFSLDAPLRDPAHGSHFTAGVDGLARVLDDRLELYGFAMASTREGSSGGAIDDPAQSGEGVAADVGARYLGTWAQPSMSALWIDESFAPDVGFVRRPGAARLRADVPLIARPRGFGVRSLSLTLSGELQSTQRFDSFLYVKGTASVSITGDEGWYLGGSADYVEDTVQRDFEVVPGVVVPAGTYRGGVLTAWASSPSARNPVAYASYSVSNAYFGGTLHNPYLSVTAIVGPWARIALSGDVYHVALRGVPELWTYAINGLVRITPATSLSIDLVARVNQEARSGTGMLRARWRFAPGSDLWLVHRTDVDASSAAPALVHTTTLKLTYRFDLLL